MADPEIERWTNYGSISLWHYEGFPKNYNGYHLAADNQGCIFLLGLVERFRNAQYPARKAIALTPPAADQLAVPNCPQQCIPAKRVEFCFRRDYADVHWSIVDHDGSIIIETGATGLCALDRGVGDILLGKGDWSTGEGTQSLWFWWHPHPTTLQNKRMESNG